MKNLLADSFASASHDERLQCILELMEKLSRDNKIELCVDLTRVLLVQAAPIKINPKNPYGGPPYTADQIKMIKKGRMERKQIKLRKKEKFVFKERTKHWKLSTYPLNDDRKMLKSGRPIKKFIKDTKEYKKEKKRLDDELDAYQNGFVVKSFFEIQESQFK